MSERELIRVIPSQAVSDGAGVQLRRSIGAVRGLYLDPFLMLDEFYSDNPDDYLAGFPEHPHRGFETVTYMLDGHMQHRDHLGNRGDLGPGSVQWMTAGRGVIHSEMPQQTEGRMRGFQLWINLPAAEKMKPAAYQDIPADGTPVVALDGGGQARVIAGKLVQQSGTTIGPIAGLSTDPWYFDLHLPADTRLTLPLPPQHTAFVYVYEGDLKLGAREQALPLRAAGVLGPGEQLRIAAAASGARLLVLAGKALNEPVVQYGPFVMNTREEIEQALADYQRGQLATA